MFSLAECWKSANEKLDSFSPLSDLSEHSLWISDLNVVRINWNLEWYQLFILVGPGGKRGGMKKQKKRGYCSTNLLAYPKSRDAIASKRVYTFFVHGQSDGFLGRLWHRLPLFRHRHLFCSHFMANLFLNLDFYKLDNSSASNCSHWLKRSVVQLHHTRCLRNAS